MKVLDKSLIISSKYYKKILQILAVSDAESRLVGGCVRDALLGKPNIDIDIATNLLPEEVIKILTNADIKTLPLGIKFGTITAFLANEIFEITTLREDLDCNGRHAKVKFTTDFAVDAARRDFTINALSYCPIKQKLYDYVSGTDDLQASIVRFIGNAEERIKEDYLRILRFFRFSCYYSSTLETVGLNACIKLQQGLNYLSAERIKSEMDKIISYNSFFVLNNMFQSGILKTLFDVKTFNLNHFNKALNFAEDHNLTFSIAGRYALLFYNLNYSTDDLINLRFPKLLVNQIVGIIKYTQEFDQKFDNTNIEFLLRKIWFEQFEEYINYIIVLVAIDMLNELTAINFIKDYSKKILPHFTINGHDLQDLGLYRESIKEALIFLKDKWIESDFKLTKESMIKLIMMKNDK